MVTNLINERGNATANQFVIYNENGITFQSYRTKIAVIASGEVFINYKMFDYSRTTSKYLAQFLRQNGWDIKSKKDIERLIKNGRFKTF